MTKIDIFSGFLGAGKTTFIKKLIEEAYKGEKLVLIENEFGTIGIDSGFLQEAGIQIMDGGWAINFPNAFHGHDPIGCNERIGKAAVHVQSHRLAKALKVLKEEENLLRWQADMNRNW